MIPCKVHATESGKAAVGAITAVLALIAAALAFSGGITVKDLLRAQTAIGKPRLIAIDPLSPGVEDGKACEWLPASAASNFAEMKTEPPASAKAARSADVAFPSVYGKRKPVRMIRDPNAAFSGVAVDVANNEVVLADENLFNMMVYDRLSNTPPQARMTEPKRIIGGMNTKIEYQCGVYIDPRNGDIYALNDDTLNELVIFSRKVKGNEPPTREVETPQGTYGITVDEDAQEMYLTIQADSAVVVYHKDAKKSEPPIRLIQGDHTLLADPHGIAVDAKNNLLYVTNYGSTHATDPRKDTRPIGKREGATRDDDGKPNWPRGLSYAVSGSGRILPASITVYTKTATGDVAPLRVIQGPKTQMDWPSGLVVDPDRDELYVANDIGDSILVFKASASGDVAPLRVLKGPKSLVKNPTGVFLDTKNNELWVSNFGNHTATVYKPAAEGDTPPLRVIRSAPLDQPAPALSNINTIAYDEKRDQILVPNCVGHPQVAAFSRLADGGAKAIRSVAGQKTLLGRSTHAIFYDSVHDEFTVPNPIAQSILTFRGSADGEQAPIRVIQGPLTQMRDPDLFTEDLVHNEIFVSVGHGILVYPREADGNVAPIRVLEGPPDAEFGFQAVAVDPVHNLLVITGFEKKVQSKIFIYNRTDDGHVAPRAMIGGPKSRFRASGGPLAVYPPKGEIIATSSGSDRLSPEAFAGVWSIEDSGDVPPRWTIGGPGGALTRPKGVALDPKHKSVIISDKGLNAVLTFYFPELY